MVGELNQLKIRGFIKELKEVSVLVLEDDEIFKLAAQTLKKSHSALRDAGFTEEQATTIVARQGSFVNLK